MTQVTYTKTQLWDAHKEGKTFAELLDGLNVAPADLNFLENTFEPACKKWSQLVAWSWLDQNIFFKDKQLLRLAERIQTEFQSKIARQAEEDSEAGSRAVAKLLVSLEKKFEPLVDTLPFSQDISFIFDPKFCDNFYLQVDGKYEGFITVDTDQKYNGKAPMFTLGLAYPFRNTLYLDWINDTTNQNEPPVYLPTGTF